MNGHCAEILYIGCEMNSIQFDDRLLRTNARRIRFAKSVSSICSNSVHVCLAYVARVAGATVSVLIEQPRVVRDHGIASAGEQPDQTLADMGECQELDGYAS